jgi:hypothetical protein
LPVIAAILQQEGLIMSDKERLTSEQSRQDRFVQIASWERRHEQREEAGLRRVRIIVGELEHSFFIRNSSPRGAMGQTSVTLRPCQLVRLKFEDGTVAPARVRWTRGTRVGLQFIRPLSVQQALTLGPARAQERDSRHRTSRRAVVASGDTYRLVNVGNISRGGAQVEASLEPGFVVNILIAGGPSLTCQVRWTKDGRSGLMFTRPVELDEFS